MSQIERSILTIIDPSIKLDKLVIPDFESESNKGTGDYSLSKMLGGFWPFITINEFVIDYVSLQTFNLDSTGFIPKLEFTFYDSNNFFQGRHYPKDGDVVQVYIRSNGDEDLYKPIRIDFETIDIYPIAGDGTTTANKFKVEGRMKIPDMYNEFCEFYEGSSFDSLIDIAENMGLGFQSNIEQTQDSQIWINPTDTREKFIQDITQNSYLDDDSFFNIFIDPYYYLTFVERNRIFSTDSDIQVGKTYMSKMLDAQGTDNVNGTEFPLFLTNIVQLQGTTNHMTKYHLLNNTGQINTLNGYKRYVQRWDLINKEFLSEFVDPLTTPGTEGMIHLKGRYIDLDSEPKPEGIAQSQSRFKYLGKQDDTVHSNFLFAAILNWQNNQELSKINLNVELDGINPFFHRGLRIFVHVMEYNSALRSALKESGENPGVVENQAERNESATVENEQKINGIENEFLTGWYIIDGISYIFRQPGPIKMKLNLVKREFNPST